MKDRLRNTKPGNYAEEKNYPIQEWHWLQQWVISHTVSNPCFGGSRGLQRDMLTAPKRGNPLDKIFIIVPMEWSDTLKPYSNH